jgi:hypothetical protein
MYDLLRTKIDKPLNTPFASLVSFFLQRPRVALRHQREEDPGGKVKTSRNLWVR